VSGEVLEPDTITVSQFRKLLAEQGGVRVLDVRTGGEFEAVHIEGSYNVPLDTLSEHAADLADIAHPVVLVCRSGGRATQAHGTLTTAGKQHLHVLEGGMDAWQASGGDVVVGVGDTWAMDRQVRLVAGSMVLAAVLTSLVVPKAKWLAAGVGSGLFYSAVSNTCAMGTVLGKLPYNKRHDCDIAGVLDDLRASA
jgi:rhodanese-related sulfurtransferase